MDISQHFNSNFIIEECRSNETLRRCQYLRYKVLCEEHHYFSPDELPNQLEEDEYDYRSAHFLISHKRNNIDTATVRVILCDPDYPFSPFPIEKFDVLRRLRRDKQWKVPRELIGEISRFSISKTFRRRINERDKIHGITPETLSNRDSGRRHMADLIVGLFKGILETSARNDLQYLYALMEPSLIRLLSKYGIVFNTIGPVVNCYGLRQPCVTKIETILYGLYHYNRENWNFITSEGKTFGTEYLNNSEQELA